MQMYFYFGVEISDFLFHNVNITTVGGLVGAILVTMLLTLGLDGLRIGRTHLDRVRMRPRVCGPGSTSNLVPRTKPFRRTSKLVLATCLHMVSVALGYVIMLIVMLYNGYIFIFFILSVGLSYFFLTPLENQLKAGLNPALAREMCGKDNPAMCDPCCNGQSSGSATGPCNGPAASPATPNGGEGENKPQGEGVVVVEVHQ